MPYIILDKLLERYYYLRNPILIFFSQFLIRLAMQKVA